MWAMKGAVAAALLLAFLALPTAVFGQTNSVAAGTQKCYASYSACSTLGECKVTAPTSYGAPAVTSTWYGSCATATATCGAGNYICASWYSAALGAYCYPSQADCAASAYSGCTCTYYASTANFAGCAASTNNNAGGWACDYNGAAAAALSGKLFSPPPPPPPPGTAVVQSTQVCYSSYSTCAATGACAVIAPVTFGGSTTTTYSGSCGVADTDAAAGCPYSCTSWYSGALGDYCYSSYNGCASRLFYNLFTNGCSCKFYGSDFCPSASNTNTGGWACDSRRAAPSIAGAALTTGLSPSPPPPVTSSGSTSTAVAVPSPPPPAAAPASTTNIYGTGGTTCSANGASSTFYCPSGYSTCCYSTSACCPSGYTCSGYQCARSSSTTAVLVGTIVGAVIGTVGGVALLIVGIVLCCRRCRGARADQQANNGAAMIVVAAPQPQYVYASPQASFVQVAMPAPAQLQTAAPAVANEPKPL